MKRTQNRKETVRRERMIMVISSVFVLAAMVCVGIYMRGQTTREQDNGYEIDFAKLETNVEEKYAELENSVQEQARLNADDAMDYMPREEVLEEGIYMKEAGSGQVEIGKLQENIKALTENIAKTEILVNEENITEEIISNQVEIQKQVDVEPAFVEATGFYLPVEGSILMHYNMDHTVYFATLDQYKYNPATIISAPEDTPIYACADATVLGIDYDEELGFSMRLDLGNGYEVTYGQIKDMMYVEGDRVLRGTQIGTVATPTKYYSVEGSNLYFAMKKNGEVASAEHLLPIQ